MQMEAQVYFDTYPESLINQENLMMQLLWKFLLNHLVMNEQEDL